MGEKGQMYIHKAPGCPEAEANRGRDTHGVGGTHARRKEQRLLQEGPAPTWALPEYPSKG